MKNALNFVGRLFLGMFYTVIAALNILNLVCYVRDTRWFTKSEY